MIEFIIFVIIMIGIWYAAYKYGLYIQKQNKGDKKISSGRYFNTRGEAEFFRRSGDRIYYDPYIGKYYIVRVEDPFWG